MRRTVDADPRPLSRLMSENAVNTYDFDEHVAEIYDQFETETDDVDLIRSLIEERGRLRILEPFCGTGRILIPLAMDGHELVGLDQARTMLDRARMKVAQLPEDQQKRITLVEGDATTSAWPGHFDLVILSGNCFYELASPREQEYCIVSAARALRSGGFVSVDNDHMEGELDETWRRTGVKTDRFPLGTCADGVRVQGTTETIWSDPARRLVRLRRTVTVTFPDGGTIFKDWIQQKHPVSALEVRTWLEKHGFAIEHVYGDRAAKRYVRTSPQAIFWARK